MEINRLLVIDLLRRKAVVHNHDIPVAPHKFEMVPGPEKSNLKREIFQLLHAVLVILKILGLRKIIRRILQIIIGLRNTRIIMGKSVIQRIPGRPGTIVERLYPVAFPGINSIVRSRAHSCPAPFGVNIEITVHVGAYSLCIVERAELVFSGIVCIFVLIEKIAGGDTQYQYYVNQSFHTVRMRV